jgi:hypothetical protein
VGRVSEPLAAIADESSFAVRLLVRLRIVVNSEASSSNIGIPVAATLTVA